MLIFDVFGTRIGVRREEGEWVSIELGSEGKHRPARGVTIPSFVEEADLLRFLADLCHESATPENPDVIQIQGDQDE